MKGAGAHVLFALAILAAAWDEVPRRQAMAQPTPSPTATPSLDVLGKSPAATIGQLSFMAGSWVGLSGTNLVEEVWLPPRAGAMFGVNRMTSGTRTDSFEFLRIETRADGLHYIVSPGGRGATAFRLIEIAPERAAFENPSQSFPRRIAYWREGPRLCAEISTPPSSGAEEQKQSWCWTGVGAP